MTVLKFHGTVRPPVWYGFWIFFLSNTLLAFSPLPPTFKSLIFLGGIALPWSLLLASSGDQKVQEGEGVPLGAFGFKLNPIFLWALAAASFLFFRFYKLDSFYFWPTGDEGQHGFLAIDLARKWNWQFFYTVGEHPPLLIWLLRLFFLSNNNAFFDLWFPPALLSSCAAALSYFAVRLFFQKPFALLCAFLMAFSFWPLYFGRFCHQGVLVPFWEVLTFVLFGLLLKEKRKPVGNILVMILGLWVGLGSMTFPSWASVMVLMIFVVGWLSLREKSGGVGTFFIFLTSLLLGLLPFLSAVFIFKEGFGHHLLNVSILGGLFTSQTNWKVPFSYVTSLFWGPLEPRADYGPVWGGLLNPLLGSCFFTGLLELALNWRKKTSWFIALALILGLLPGLLSVDYVEFYRVIQIMPFLLLTAALGIKKLLGRTAPKNQTAVLALLLVFSTGLDLFHLFKPRLENFMPFRTGALKGIDDQNFKIYQMLESAGQESGPGLVFTDFLLLNHGHTLSTAAYSFNILSNPHLRNSKARWAAVIANREYEPFLSKRFPGAQWRIVGTDPSGEDLTVGIIPITAPNQSLWEKWIKADFFFHFLQRQSDGMFNNKTRYFETLQRLPEGYSLVQGDPFLESIYGEWVAQYYFSPSSSENAAAIKRALGNGYPAPHLFYKLSNFLFQSQDLQGAKKAYQMGRKLPVMGD